MKLTNWAATGLFVVTGFAAATPGSASPGGSRVSLPAPVRLPGQSVFNVVTSPDDSGIRLCAGSCEVKVTAYAPGAAGERCTVSVDAFAVVVPRSQTADIHWTIANSSEYEFGTAGIELLRRDGTSASDDLESGGYDAATQQFTWHSHNKRLRGFNYALHLRKKGTTDECEPSDPIIVNMGAH
jgi:hypothetical protein